MFRNIVLCFLIVLSVGCASARIATPVAEAVVPETPVEPTRQEAAAPAEPLALAQEPSEVPAEPMPALYEYSDQLYEELSPKAEEPAEVPVSVPENKKSAAVVTIAQEAPAVASPTTPAEPEPIVRAAEISPSIVTQGVSEAASGSSGDVASSGFPLTGALVLVIAGCALWITHLEMNARKAKIATAQHLREIDELRERILSERRENAKRQTPATLPPEKQGVLKEFQKSDVRGASPQTPRKRVVRAAAKKPPSAETRSPHNKKGDNEAIH